MCGIIGIISSNPVAPSLLEALKRMEYRGYDSAGIATVNGTIERVRAEGKLANLEAALTKKNDYRHNRHRPHPLGNPWRPDGTERPSPCH